jgi:hypothetical protein
MKAKGLWLVAAVVTLGLLSSFLTPTAEAQAVYGSILGTVSDPQGAAVAGAKVTVTNQRKGTSEETTTKESGNYSVTHLIPDIYTVRVEAAGFKAVEQKDVVVSVDTGSRVDLQVQVGGTTETVARRHSHYIRREDGRGSALVESQLYQSRAGISGHAEAGGLEPRSHRKPTG